MRNHFFLLLLLASLLAFVQNFSEGEVSALFSREPAQAALNAEWRIEPVASGTALE